ncbi:MAG: hypothetical protein ACRDLS_11950, partial [Solirubrobacteraceae bacterium]
GISSHIASAVFGFDAACAGYANSAIAYAASMIGAGKIRGATRAAKGGGRLRELGRRFADETGSFSNLSLSQLRAVRSLEKQAAKHQAKLDAYRADPDAFDNLGLLRNAPSPEIRQRIIDGRIRHLEGEVSTFRRQIDEITGGN